MLASTSNREFTNPNEARNAYQYMWRFPGQFENYGYILDEEGKPRNFRNAIGIRDSAFRDKTATTQTRMQAFTIFNPFKGFYPSGRLYILASQHE